MTSAAVLTHNDVSTLERCLESLLWCDERIVIDDNSSDATQEIAKRMGATVYTRALNNDFAAQRNFGLEKATGEWVFFVDSDEVVTGELAEEIKNATKSRYSMILSEGDTAPVGYYLGRKDYFGGRWFGYGETSRVRLLRLAKKGAGKWVRPVHEVWDVKGNVGELTHPLLHYPHPNVAQFLDEVNRYSTLNASYVYKNGIRVRWWQIVVYPVVKFVINYIFRLGFLDGTAGAIVAIMMSFHSFLTRSKLWLLWNKQSTR